VQLSGETAGGAADVIVVVVGCVKHATGEGRGGVAVGVNPWGGGLSSPYGATTPW